MARAPRSAPPPQTAPILPLGSHSKDTPGCLGGAGESERGKFGRALGGRIGPSLSRGGQEGERERSGVRGRDPEARRCAQIWLCHPREGSDPQTEVPGGDGGGEEQHPD